MRSLHATSTVICAYATAIMPSTTLCPLQSIVSSQARIRGNERPLLSEYLMAWVMSARLAHNLHHGLQTPDGVSQQPQYPDRSNRKQLPSDQSPPASAPASANISGSASTSTENFPPTPTASAVRRRSGPLLKSCLRYWRSATPALAADQRHRKRDSAASGQKPIRRPSHRLADVFQ